MESPNYYFYKILWNYKVFSNNRDQFERFLERDNIDVAAFVKIYLKTIEFENELYKKFTIEQKNKVK